MSQKLPDQLLQWLYRVLQSQYINPILAYQDVSLILLAYPKSNFKPSTKIYLNEKGDQKLLLNLQGVVPIAEGHPALVPFEISIPHEYPQQPPIIFITPTKDTLISPNNNFDNNGRFYHPILANSWYDVNSNVRSNDGIKPNENRLLLLIETLIDTIHRNIPLTPLNSIPPPQYETSIPHQTQVQPQSQSQSQSPIPPPIPMKPSSSTTSIHTSNNNNNTAQLSQPIPQHRSESSSSTQQPPIPPLPQKPISRVESSSSVGTNTATATVTTKSNKNYNNNTDANNDIPIQVHVPATVTTTTGANAPLLPPNPHRAQTMQAIQAQLNSIMSDELKPEFLEKIMGPMDKIDDEIKYYQAKKERDTQQLEYLELQSKSNQVLLSSKIDEVRVLLQDCHTVKRPVIEKIDEYFIPETPVYSQLYDLVTQDEAISDTLYYLEKAHDNGVVKFDSYLTSSRSLAREQCMIKLHIEKLVHLCGLNK